VTVGPSLFRKENATARQIAELLRYLDELGTLFTG